MKNKKFAIVDESFLDPFKFTISSIGGSQISSCQFCGFFENHNIMLLSNSVCFEELGYSYANGTLFDFSIEDNVNDSSLPELKTVYINDSGGTVTSNLGGFFRWPIYIFPANSFPFPADEFSRKSKLSIPDKSLIAQVKYVTNLPISGSHVRLLTNDRSLRKSASDDSISVSGSASCLAAMVISGSLSYQKGTAIYGKWGMEDPHWIPPREPFKNVLLLERGRMNDGNSFWL